MATTLTFLNSKAFWSKEEICFGQSTFKINVPFKVRGHYDSLWLSQFNSECSQKGIEVAVRTKYLETVEFVLKLNEDASALEFKESAKSIRCAASICDQNSELRDEKLKMVEKWDEKTDYSMFDPVTAQEIIEGTARIMSDPKAQKAWAEEMDEKGYYVSFNGPFPSIGTKEIYVSSNMVNYPHDM